MRPGWAEGGRGVWLYGTAERGAGVLRHGEAWVANVVALPWCGHELLGPFDGMDEAMAAAEARLEGEG